MSSSSENTFYDLKAELPSGQTYDFEQLKGKVVLVVNVASKWYVNNCRRSMSIHLFGLSSGFTPQYKGEYMVLEDDIQLTQGTQVFRLCTTNTRNRALSFSVSHATK